MKMSLHRNTGVLDGDRKVSNIRQKHAAQCGFSLIELIVVISIMAVLVGLLVPQFVKFARQKREDTCKHNREAILRIYERAVYDGSVQAVLLNDDGIAKIIDKTYKPAASEVEQYLICPNRSGGGAAYHGYVMDGVGAEGADKTGSASIYCPDCDNTVSIDLLGWSTKDKDEGSDPDRVPPPTPEPESKEDVFYTVSFNLNGVNASPKPADQKVKKGETATDPATINEQPKKAFYEFLGWYENSAGEGSKYTFTESVDDNVTLYAKWKSQSGDSSVWPYSDDQTWWDPNLINSYHSGQYSAFHSSNESNIGSFSNNAKLDIYVPTGIFTSRAGAQFVYINSSTEYGTGVSKDLFLKYASSPEYYSAKFPQYLIQLTGNVKTYNITDLDNNLSQAQEIKPDPYLINGDIIEFIDGEQTYRYVYFHEQVSGSNNSDISISNLGIIRNYSKNQIGNMFRVDPAPVATTE